MGEAELDIQRRQLVIHSAFYFYGDAASEEISTQVATDIADHWNEAGGKTRIKGTLFDVRFDIRGYWGRELTPVEVYENTDPRNNYFRIEEYAEGNISFVDAINCNSGYFKLDNLLHNSTTAAHEFGHTIGLVHPPNLDIRGMGVPGIMYPRGTLVDPPFQYDPAVPAGEKGGTLNPFLRKVLPQDVDLLKLHKLPFNRQGTAMIGDFTSVWHDKHLP
ncbi:MAG: peptidase M10 [Chitinophagaceae bacterium]|nr:peptidase M10 [Chitinophagaceae bacterium]